MQIQHYRRYPIEKSGNMRDLGGWATQSGRPTQYARLIRSDLPGSLLPQEQAMLLRLGLATVVDLRSAEEAARKPSVFAAIDGVAYHHLPMDETGGWSEEEEDVAQNLLNLAECDAVPKVLCRLAEARGAALFHCNAGKDRTGVIAALALANAGVVVPDIVADYEVSYGYNIKRVKRMHSQNPNLPAWLGQSKPEYMYGLFRLLKERYGGAESFLKTRVEEGTTAALREKLLVP